MVFLEQLFAQCVNDCVQFFVDGLERISYIMMSCNRGLVHWFIASVIFAIGEAMIGCSFIPTETIRAVNWLAAVWFERDLAGFVALGAGGLME